MKGPPFRREGGWVEAGYLVESKLEIFDSGAPDGTGGRRESLLSRRSLPYIIHAAAKKL